MTSTKRLSSTERRAAIVREAVRLFAERGFRGATTRELASAVGVSEPVLYEHFRTKRELYEAILDAKSREGEGRFAALAESHLDARDDWGFFEGLADVVLDFYESNPEYVRLLLFSALESHEMGEMFYLRHRKIFFGPVTGYIEHRIREGTFRKVDAMLAARAFGSMVAHIAQHLVLFPAIAPRTGRKELIRGLVEIFLNGVARDKRAPANKRKR